MSLLRHCHAPAGASLRGASNGTAARFDVKFAITIIKVNATGIKFAESV